MKLTHIRSRWDDSRPFTTWDGIVRRLTDILVKYSSLYIGQENEAFTAFCRSEFDRLKEKGK